ncbi:MAG: phosphonate metabolism protein/1,5-bisphosphokinase (PRPP-forming) PhnN [Alphaproteobacteria bacterium]|nr:phosphonate metabolism protein/1,5-bisphosphokinase (PRPP-forming) PhnN [Alphaproteobacteria bacterium]
MNGLAGRLVLVVGPSGAGKDSVIAEARNRLSGNSRFVFATRTITRPAEAGGEIHEPASQSAFDAREQSGGFLLSWRAHGLSYGIPAAYGDELASGRVVVANVSRTVIEQARQRFPGHVHVVVITASRDVLAERLAQRGRETSEEILERLARTPAFYVDGAGVLEVRNEGSLKDASDSFIRFLEQL